MDVGIDRFVFHGANAPSGPGSNPVPDLLDEIVHADRAGLAAFGIGEHHTAGFADASPAVLLAAGAALTRRIRLSSAISILSVADPVRLMEDFATLDLVSNGRAEIIVGRGAYAEAFELFGADLAQYDALFAEKLDLLLRLRSGDPVHWRGRFRPPLLGQTSYPRPLQRPLPVWIGATGSPESFARAGTLGLPLALAVLGGSFARLAAPVALYREAGRRAGHGPEKLQIAVHAIGYVGESSGQSRADFLPGYDAVFGEMVRRGGQASLDRATFDVMTGPDEALVVGDEGEVSAKIKAIGELLGGVSRFCLQMTVGPLPHDLGLAAIERLGRVARSFTHERENTPAASPATISLGDQS